MVEVVGCVPLAEVKGDPFAVGPWCWLLARARPIRPVPFRGQVGLFDVPNQIVKLPRGTPKIDPGGSDPTERRKGRW